MLAPNFREMLYSATASSIWLTTFQRCGFISPMARSGQSGEGGKSGFWEAAPQPLRSASPESHSRHLYMVYTQTLHRAGHGSRVYFESWLPSASFRGAYIACTVKPY